MSEHFFDFTREPAMFEEDGAMVAQRSPLPPRLSPARPWLDNRQFRIRQLSEKIRITATCRWRMRQRASYRIGNVVAKVLRVID